MSHNELSWDIRMCFNIHYICHPRTLEEWDRNNRRRRKVPMVMPGAGHWGVTLSPPETEHGGRLARYWPQAWVSPTLHTLTLVSTGLHHTHLRHHRPSGVCCPYWIMSPCLHPNQTCKPCFIRLECLHLKTFSDRKFQGPLLIKPLSAFWILYSPLFQTLLTFYMSHRYLLFRSQDKWTGNNNNGLTNNTN